MEVSVYDEEIEYRDTGMKIAARMTGYLANCEDDRMITVFIDLFNSDSKWWQDENMLKFALSHEVGHAVYKADLGVRYYFNSLKQEMPAKMWEYVIERYPAWSWDEELFANGFAAWITDVDKWGTVQMDSSIIGEVRGIEKWKRN